MHIGITQFSTGYTIRIDELARECEDRGFESLFVPEHTHIPTSRRSPWPGGADLPEGVQAHRRPLRRTRLRRGVDEEAAHRHRNRAAHGT